MAEQKRGTEFLWYTSVSISLVDLSGLQSPHLISDCILAVIPSLALSHLQEEDLITSNSHLYALKLASHWRIRDASAFQIWDIWMKIKTDTFSHVYMSKLSSTDPTETTLDTPAHTQTSPALSDAPKYLLVSWWFYSGWILQDLCCNHELLGIPWTLQKWQQIPELRHLSRAFSPQSEEAELVIHFTVKETLSCLSAQEPQGLLGLLSQNFHWLYVST